MATLARLVTYLAADTVQFDTGFAKATQTMGKFGASTVEMNKGLGMAKNAVQTLAFQVAGVEGPIGKLGTSLLMFGVGGAYTTAFLAGFVAMRKAMEFWEKDATERAERVGNLNMTAMQGMRDPRKDALVNVLSARTNLKDAQAGLAGAGSVSDAKATLTYFISKQAEVIAEMAETERTFRASIAGMLGGAGVLASSAISVFGAAPTGPLLANSAGPLGTRGTSMAAIKAGLNFKASQLTTTTGSRGFHISGQDAAFAGLGAFEGLLNGGGFGAVGGAAGGLIGNALLPGFGGAIGGFLGSKLGGLFGGGGEDPAVIELRKQTAILQATLDIERRREISEVTLVNRRSGRDPRDIDAIRDILRDVGDRKLRLELV